MEWLQADLVAIVGGVIAAIVWAIRVEGQAYRNRETTCRNEKTLQQLQSRLDEIEKAFRQHELEYANTYERKNNELIKIIDGFKIEVVADIAKLTAQGEGINNRLSGVERRLDSMGLHLTGMENTKN